MTSLTYPNYGTLNSNGSPIPQAGMTYTYSYDAMERPVGLVDNQTPQVTWVQSGQTTYNAADQLTQMTYGKIAYQETRQYNSLQQVTRLTVARVVGSTTVYDVQYGFNSPNNGRLWYTVDNTGEAVHYYYDTLNRLDEAEGK